MKVIEARRNLSLDHIIPQSFFNNTGINADPREFNDEWNLQVMHKVCNTKRAGFIPRAAYIPVPLPLLPSNRR